MLPGIAVENKSAAQMDMEFWTIAPYGMGVMDALEQMNCSPSAYYEGEKCRLAYIEGYLSVKPRNRGALVLHRLYTTGETELQGLYDDLHNDCLAVDEAQACEFDWRV